MRRAAVLLVLSASCAHDPGPEAAARGYLQALARGDLAAAHALTIGAVRSSTPAAALAVLEGARTPAIEAWTLTLEGGRRLSLVREEDGAWRVDDEALRARALSDPRGATVAFLRAAIAADPAAARAFLPDAARSRLADDTQLRAYLVELRPRLERARDALGDLTRRTALVEGDHAQIPYDERRAVRLVREHGQWRIVDVE